MRLTLLITVTLLLINVTTQEKSFSKFRQRNEVEKLQVRLPVKNYINLPDNEKRKVNKYKDDASEESEEVSEEKPRKHFIKHKQEKFEKLKSKVDKKQENKRISERNPKSLEFKSEEVGQNRRVSKTNFNSDKGPTKYNNKQKHDKGLSEESKEYNNFVSKKTKRFDYPGINMGNKPPNKFNKKHVTEDTGSSVENETGTSYYSKENPDENEESLQCDSVDEDDCDY